MTIKANLRFLSKLLEKKNNIYTIIIFNTLYFI